MFGIYSQSFFSSVDVLPQIDKRACSLKTSITYLVFLYMRAAAVFCPFTVGQLVFCENE
jgi:hypothetical protein